jgi:hypothetical protein
MSWGRPNKPDLKDQMIAYLQEQCATKDLQIADLHRELLALAKPGAYRMLHPKDEPQETVTTLGETPILSPSRIPAYKITDEKMWEATAKRFEDKVIAMQHDEASKES